MGVPQGGGDRDGGHTAGQQLRSHSGNRPRWGVEADGGLDKHVLEDHLRGVGGGGGGEGCKGPRVGRGYQECSPRIAKRSGRLVGGVSVSCGWVAVDTTDLLQRICTGGTLSPPPGPKRKWVCTVKKGGEMTGSLNAEIDK